MRPAGHPPDVAPATPCGAARARGRRRYVYLRVCEGCGDRRILEAVRYGRCHGCEARDRYLVVKATGGAAGRRALGRLTLTGGRALQGGG